jgi:hypothetical protein
MGAAAVSFDDRIFLLGGLGYYGVFYPNARSIDGINWYEATLVTPWSLYLHAVIIHNDRLWVLGGVGKGYSNTVWASY